MEKTILNIIVLGSTGMIGHKICEVICKNNNFRIFNVSRSRLSDDTKIIDLRNFKKVEALLNDISPDIVINAAGILIEDSKNTPLDAVLLNTVLPLSLNKLSKKLKFKLIQISTDCVFSGDNGPYNISDIKDAKTTYGKTKSLGEIYDNNNLTIRTSVIGPDLKKNGKELFNWFMNQSGRVNGFSKSIWSGVTTLELARCIEKSIINNSVGIKHLSSKKSISKYDLLSIIKNYLPHTTYLNKIDGPITNKVLINRKNSIYSVDKSYEKLIEEMIIDIMKNGQYAHYKFNKKLKLS